MRARATSAVVALLLTVSMTGCSGGDGDDYCEALRAEKATLADLAAEADSRRSDIITPTLEAFERLRAAAPTSLKDEWDTLVLAEEALSDAVAEAGVDPAEYRPGKTPEGLSAAQADRLAAVASKLGSPRVQDAAGGVEQHAREVCGVSFSG